MSKPFPPDVIEDLGHADCEVCNEARAEVAIPEPDKVVCGEIFDPQLGKVRYSITTTIDVICPSCGNTDCVEIEEFKERLKRKIKQTK